MKLSQCLQSHVSVLSSQVSILSFEAQSFSSESRKDPKSTIISYIRYNSIHDYLDVQNHMYPDFMGLYIQRENAIVETSWYQKRQNSSLVDWVKGGDILGDSTPPMSGVNDICNENWRPSALAWNQEQS